MQFRKSNFIANANSLAWQRIFAKKCPAVGRKLPSARAANWVFSGRVEILSFIFTIRVLLLDLGRWGVNHLRNLHAMPIQLYVAEVDSKRLERARKLGLPEAQLTTNYKECIDKMDSVIVVTPAQTHFPLCSEFLVRLVL